MSDVTMTAIEAAYRTAVAVKLRAVHDYRSDDVCPECRRTDCEGDCGASRKPVDSPVAPKSAGKEVQMEKYTIELSNGQTITANREVIGKIVATETRLGRSNYKLSGMPKDEMAKAVEDFAALAKAPVIQNHVKATIAIPAGQAPATPFVRKPRKQYKGATPVDGRTLNGKIDKVVAKSTNMVTIVKGAERVDRFCPDVLAFLADAKAKGVPTFSAKFADGTPVVERLQANS